MNHRKAGIMLARRHELNGAEEATLRAHLEQCDDCSHTAAAYAKHERALRNIVPAEPPAGLRHALLAHHVQPRPNLHSRRKMLLVGTLAATLLLGLGITLSRALPASTRSTVSEAVAVRAALPHSVVASYRPIPHTVRVEARLGQFSGVPTAWLVTISGPGVSVIPPTALGARVRVEKPPLLHRETVVIDGTTGAFVETYTAAG